MRDVFAAVAALVLLLVAASLATTLQMFRRRRLRAFDSERALGRVVIAEIPAGDDLSLFSEDDVRFYYGERSVDKDLIVAVRVLIEHGVIAGSDLGLLSDPAWCSRQEDLWWSRELRAGQLARRRTRADLEPYAGAARTGSGHDRRVLPHRNRAAEEIVSLVDRVAERALPVGHRPVR